MLTSSPIIRKKKMKWRSIKRKTSLVKGKKPSMLHQVLKQTLILRKKLRWLASMTFKMTSNHMLKIMISMNLMTIRMTFSKIITLIIWR